MDLNGLFCKMPRSSSVEPPARFPYTILIVCPQCPLTVLTGVEGGSDKTPGAARRPQRLITGVRCGGCDAQGRDLLTVAHRRHGRGPAPPRPRRRGIR